MGYVPIANDRSRNCQSLTIARVLSTFTRRVPRLGHVTVNNAAEGQTITTLPPPGQTFYFAAMGMNAQVKTSPAIN
ncbi:hypothetical protein GCM10025779_24240 [Arthrobacter cryoconiti]